MDGETEWHSLTMLRLANIILKAITILISLSLLAVYYISKNAKKNLFFRQIILSFWASFLYQIGCEICAVYDDKNNNKLEEYGFAVFVIGGIFWNIICTLIIGLIMLKGFTAIMITKNIYRILK